MKKKRCQTFAPWVYKNKMRRRMRDEKEKKREREKMEMWLFLYYLSCVSSSVFSSETTILTQRGWRHKKIRHLKKRGRLWSQDCISFMLSWTFLSTSKTDWMRESNSDEKREEKKSHTSQESKLLLHSFLFRKSRRVTVKNKKQSDRFWSKKEPDEVERKI